MNKRPRRQQQNGDNESRLLSSAAFEKISETLGALNTVGHYLVNMTRGQDGGGSVNGGSSQQMSGSSESIPDAILTLTKNVLGQNVTKSIEPLIKRVGDGEHSSIITDHHRRKKKRDHSTKKESIMASTSVTTSEQQISSTKNVTAEENVTTTEPSILIISSSVKPGKYIFPENNDRKLKMF